MPAKVEDLLQAYETLKAQRQPWESTWQAISETMMPAFNDITSPRQPGTRRTGQLFDSTGLQACSLLASHIASGITNWQTLWAGLRMSYEPLNDIKSISVWLDRAAQIMHDRLAASNAPEAFQNFYRQFCGFNTAAILMDHSELPGLDGRYDLLNRSLPIATYCLAENAAGSVDTLYRDLDLSPRQAIQEFGVDGVHETVKRANEQAHLRHVPSAYLHAVYPRNDRDPNYENQVNMPYASCYVDVQNKHLCREGGYRWFPYMVSRWEKLRTWSPYGFGPGHIALPEVLTLNLMDRDILRALQLYILPPYWTDDPDAVGRVVLMPGRINPIAQGRKIESMRGPGQFDISKLDIEERRQRVRAAFFMDQLLTLPAPDQTGKMTAYEVAQRIGYMQRLMGPAFMALLGGLLNPAIDVTFGWMLEEGEFPQPPDELIIAATQGYGKITVDYQGPLARAQRGDEIVAIEGTLAMAERYYAQTQDISVYDNFDIDELIQRTGKVYGVPASVLTDAKAREEKRQARAEAQQQAQQTEQLIEGAKALGPASQMVRALQPAETPAA